MPELFVDKMTPEQIANARKWISDLRSGNYEQGTGRLRRGNYFCCLGVACDSLGVNWMVGSRTSAAERFPDGVFGQDGALSERQRVALGLRTNEGHFLFEGAGGSSLVILNDDARDSFDDLANLIEAELDLVEVVA